MKFGAGDPVGHRGGRLVWQLQGAEELLVCWQTVQHDNPRNVERELIQAFKSFHKGRRRLPICGTRVRTHYSHQMTAAARAIAAMKFLMLRSKRVAIRRQSLRRQNMRSMMLRCL